MGQCPSAKGLKNSRLMIQGFACVRVREEEPHPHTHTEGEEGGGSGSLGSGLPELEL